MSALFSVSRSASDKRGNVAYSHNSCLKATTQENVGKEGSPETLQRSAKLRVSDGRTRGGV